MRNTRALSVTGAILAVFGVLAQLAPPAGAASAGDDGVKKDGKTGTARGGAVYFEKNLGQYDGRVIFAGKGNGQTVFLTADAATFVTPLHDRKPSGGIEMTEKKEAVDEKGSVYALRMKFAGINPEAEAVFEEELQGKLGYFKGSDPSKWVPEVTRYGRVTSRGIYKGIDLTWYENADRAMEYDFNVAPNADPEQIQLDFEGADLISVNSSGDLVLETLAGPMVQKKPVVYQESGGQKQPVESGYIVNGHRVSFALGDYDRSKTLVIDPLPPLIYSTFLGGSDLDLATSVKADQSGYAYVTGYTYSANYPITTGVNPADSDAFVSKLSPGGNLLIYSKLIGGSGNDAGASIALDGSGNMYVTGETSSADFPVSWLAYDQSYNGSGDGFITKINTAGGVAYSNYIGGSGSDRASGIAVDSEGSAYITGSTTSSNYPTTSGAYDQTIGHTQDAFVTKFNSNGLSLAYSTYLGGSGSSERGNAIAVDSLGRAYVAGVAHGGGAFPVTPGSYSTANNTTLPDCFITKFNSAGSALAFSTIFGGDGQDEAASIDIDSSGNAYITGSTGSDNYPTTLWAFDTSHTAVLSAAFVTKLNSTGASLGNSTYLEGNDGATRGFSIVADNSGGKVTLVGYTSSAGFPVGPYAWDVTYNGSQDAFLVRMPTAGFMPLITSTFLGGSGYDTARGLAVDSGGYAVIVGDTASANYPVYGRNPYDTAFNGAKDAFVTRYEADYLP